MNAKKLLILMITMFLPTATTSLIGTATQYGDTESLLSDTTAELMQAYDLLEMLKRRSEEVAQTSVVPDFDSCLPRNLDQIRKPLKAKLLEVLSATPFSDPEKHLADCQEAIVALEHYLGTLKSITAQQQDHQARAPIAYVPRSRGMHRKAVRRHRTSIHTETQAETQPVTTPATSDGFDQLAKAYDLNEPITTTPAVSTPAATPQAPAPTAPTPTPAVSAPVATTPAPTPEPVTPAPNPFAALFKTPAAPTTALPAPTPAPVTPPITPTITPIPAAPLSTPATPTTTPKPVTPTASPSIPLFKVPTSPAAPTPTPVTPTTPPTPITPAASTPPATNPFADMFKTPAKPVTPTPPAAIVPAPATVPGK